MKLPQRIALTYLRTKFKLLSAISKKKAAEKAFRLFCTPQRRNLKTLPKIFEAAEQLQFRLEGIPIRGWRWNHPAQKKLLIIHGFESSVVNFDRFITPAIKKGYEVLAFDAPAHGRSGSSYITAPLFKRMIIHVWKQFGPLDAVIAHSFGGLAASLALEETNHTDAVRLVLIAPATETTTAIGSFFRFLHLDSSLRPAFDKVIIKNGGVSPEWYSIRRAMRHIRAQVLWVHDTEDDTTPIEDVKNVQKDNFSQIQFVITKGLGHRRIYRDNEVTKKIMAFL